MPYVIQPDNHTQRDGTRYVTEIHSDAQGEFSRAHYRGNDAQDRDAIATSRHAKLLDAMAEQELREAIESGTMPPMRFLSPATALVLLREAYREARQETLAKIARWIRNRVTDGEVTQAQLRNAFGLTAGQWTTLKAKMDALAASLDAIETAEGE